MMPADSGFLAEPGVLNLKSHILKSSISDSRSQISDLRSQISDSRRRTGLSSSLTAAGPRRICTAFPVPESLFTCRAPLYHGFRRCQAPIGLTLNRRVRQKFLTRGKCCHSERAKRVEESRCGRCRVPAGTARPLDFARGDIKRSPAGIRSHTQRKGWAGMYWQRSSSPCMLPSHIQDCCRRVNHVAPGGSPGVKRMI